MTIRRIYHTKVKRQSGAGDIKVHLAASLSSFDRETVHSLNEYKTALSKEWHNESRKENPGTRLLHYCFM